MIWESHHWKEPLLEDRDYLLRFRISDSTTEKTLAGIEKRLFLSFYSIRKLIEAEKLTNATCESKWKLFRHKKTSRVDRLNWHKIEEKYDLEKKEEAVRDLQWICNQIIHSFVFTPNFDEKGKLSGFYVSTDRERNKFLYHLDRTSLFQILKRVGTDYPSSSESHRDSKGD